VIGLVPESTQAEVRSRDARLVFSFDRLWNFCCVAFVGRRARSTATARDWLHGSGRRRAHAQMAAAASSAQAAFLQWREVPPQQRVRTILKLQALIRDHQDELARLVSLEQVRAACGGG
jgi:hypothetical protein